MSEILAIGPVFDAGIVLIAAAMVLDFVFRFRMVRLGYKWAFLQGGAFDYRNYHSVRAEHGWAAWPVYLMWSLIVCGIVLMIAGFFGHSGLHPTH